MDVEDYPDDLSTILIESIPYNNEDHLSETRDTRYNEDKKRIAYKLIYDVDERDEQLIQLEYDEFFKLFPHKNTYGDKLNEVIIIIPNPSASMVRKYVPKLAGVKNNDVREIFKIMTTTLSVSELNEAFWEITNVLKLSKFDMSIKYKTLFTNYNKSIDKCRDGIYAPQKLHSWNYDQDYKKLCYIVSAWIDNWYIVDLNVGTLIGNDIERLRHTGAFKNMISDKEYYIRDKYEYLWGICGCQSYRDWRIFKEKSRYPYVMIWIIHMTETLKPNKKDIEKLRYMYGLDLKVVILIDDKTNVIEKIEGVVYIPLYEVDGKKEAAASYIFHLCMSISRNFKSKYLKFMVTTEYKALNRLLAGMYNTYNLGEAPTVILKNALSPLLLMLREMDPYNDCLKTKREKELLNNYPPRDEESKKKIIELSDMNLMVKDELDKYPLSRKNHKVNIYQSNKIRKLRIDEVKAILSDLNIKPGLGIESDILHLDEVKASKLWNKITKYFNKRKYMDTLCKQDVEISNKQLETKNRKNAMALILMSPWIKNWEYIDFESNRCLFPNISKTIKDNCLYNYNIITEEANIEYLRGNPFDKLDRLIMNVAELIKKKDVRLMFIDYDNVLHFRYISNKYILEKRREGKSDYIISFCNVQTRRYIEKEQNVEIKQLFDDIVTLPIIFEAADFMISHFVMKLFEIDDISINNDVNKDKDKYEDKNKIMIELLTDDGRLIDCINKLEPKFDSNVQITNIRKETMKNEMTDEAEGSESISKHDSNIKLLSSASEYNENTELSSTAMEFKPRNDSDTKLSPTASEFKPRNNSDTKLSHTASQFNENTKLSSTAMEFKPRNDLNTKLSPTASEFKPRNNA